MPISTILAPSKYRPIALVWCLLLILSSATRSTAKERMVAQRAPLSGQKSIDCRQHFRDLKVTGSILIEDRDRQFVYQSDPQRNATAFLPASTFKILNSLIALETKVIPNERAVFTWDGIERQVPQWNRDLDLQSAFKLSAIWYYQVLARRVGFDRMQTWVTRVGYGNGNIGTKQDIDRFWLSGQLRITPQAQVQFLRRLEREDLPFSKRSMSIVKQMLIEERTPHYTLRGKTGWVGFADRVEPKIGWHVGYLERDRRAYFFATNIDLKTKADAKARQEITRRCLRDFGLL
jgi:beta-lactamase class D